MTFHTQNWKNKTDLFIYTGEFKIPQVEDVNFLGLLVDKNLYWNLQVYEVISGISSGIFALSKVRYLCDVIL